MEGPRGGWGLSPLVGHWAACWEEPSLKPGDVGSSLALTTTTTTTK